MVTAVDRLIGNVLVRRLLATAMRAAVLTTTAGAAHAVVDALAPVLERIVRMSTPKALLPATIVFALFIAGRPVHAQPDGPEDDVVFAAGGLTADRAAARARTSSPTVQRRLAELDAAIANVSAAENLRVPQLTTRLSYTRLSPIDTPDALAQGSSAFPTGPLDVYDAQAQLVVPLSDYVLRYPGVIGAARLGRRAAAVGARASEADAAFGARRAYYEWARARLQLAISSRQLVQVRANVEQMRALVAVERIARAELLRVEAQEAEAEQAYNGLQELAALREQVLRIQIGAHAGEVLAIGEDLRADVMAPRSSAPLDELVTDAGRRRLDVQRLDLGVAINEQRRLAEHANAMPRLSAFAVTDYANPNQRAIPAVDAFTWSWSAGVQVTWSLPDALASRTTRRRLAAESAALRADRDAVLRQTRIEVLTAQQGVALAQLATNTTRKGLVAAEEGYRVRSALLANERAAAIELVDAQTTLTRARIAALDARIDLRIAIAELAHALGTDTIH